MFTLYQHILIGKLSRHTCMKFFLIQGLNSQKKVEEEEMLLNTWKEKRYQLAEIIYNSIHPR